MSGFRTTVALFYVQKVRAPAAPFEVLSNLLLFFQERRFCKLRLIVSGSAPLLFLERVYILCLETSIVHPSLSDEGRTFTVESGATCLSSNVTDHLVFGHFF